MTVVNISGKEYDNFIEGKGLALVDFWADWCAPCKAVKPVLEMLSARLGDKVKLALVDIDEEGALAGRLQVSSIPHINIYKDGVLVDTIRGALPEAALMSRLNPHLLHC